MHTNGVTMVNQLQIVACWWLVHPEFYFKLPSVPKCDSFFFSNYREFVEKPIIYFELPRVSNYRSFKLSRIDCNNNNTNKFWTRSLKKLIFPNGQFLSTLTRYPFYIYAVRSTWEKLLPLGTRKYYSFDVRTRFTIIRIR